MALVIAVIVLLVAGQVFHDWRELRRDAQRERPVSLSASLSPLLALGGLLSVSLSTAIAVLSAGQPIAGQFRSIPRGVFGVQFAFAAASMAAVIFAIRRRRGGLLLLAVLVIATITWAAFTH